VPDQSNQKQIFTGFAPLNELHTTPKNKTVVLVSLPGVRHNVFLNLLRALPQTSVCEAYGALSAFEFIEINQVDVIVIDTNIPFAERLALIARIKNNFPHIQCLAFITTSKEKRLLESAGADKILFQGYSLQAIEEAVFS